MTDTGHGVTLALNRGGNDGWAAIEESVSGRIIVTVEGDSRTRANVEITILPSPEEGLNAH